jgi:hypothetical protein
LSLARTADRVYVGLSAPTSGWVAVGTGSRKMEGARIYIGYVKDGVASFEEDAGKGHRHSADTAGPSVSSAHALSQGGGRTVLEVALDASKVIAAGATELQLILAYGSDASLASFHQSFTALAVALK